MNHISPEYQSSSEIHKSNELSFIDKFRDMLPGIEFEESVEMLEARMAVLEALKNRRDRTSFNLSGPSILLYVNILSIAEPILTHKFVPNFK
jgi:hypothetical protein